MSAHMRKLPTKEQYYIDVKVGMPSGKKMSYHIPFSAQKKLSSFLKELDIQKDEIESWEKATPWEELAEERIKKYKKAGLVLRGARYRENMSQVELSKRCAVHQNEISKIENGKRAVGKKIAQRLAKALNFDYRLLIN